MRDLLLNKGFISKVDDEDYEWLNQWNWTVSESHGNYYAMRNTYKYYKATKVRLHRLIMSIKDPKVSVDHIDGNGLNNQKSNLRLATHSQNRTNSIKRKVGVSKYKGVHKSVHIKWFALCSYNKISYRKGCNTEVEAALAYNEMALKYHGEFARLNIIDGETIKSETVKVVDEKEEMEREFLNSRKD